MRARILLTLAAALGGLALIAPATHARPPACSVDVVQQALLTSGKLTQEDIDNQAGVSLVRCGDMTGDGVSDALFTIASGGTAGDTHFGVLKGNADGTLGARILYKQAYKVGIARHSSRSFDVLQPFYAAHDPNCCPSSFRQTRYTFSGNALQSGQGEEAQEGAGPLLRVLATGGRAPDSVRMSASPVPTPPPTAASAGRTAWARNLAAPIRSYLHDETGGAVVLASAAVAALLWANVSPSTYASVWHTHFAIVIGDHELASDLRGWINEGLMTLFFLVVGLEAKRELDLGELRERTRLAIPVVASLGGMIDRGGIYLAINAGGDGAVGWGVAVSTDTALALGALALLTRSRAIRLRVFLLTVVVIDDLAALVVIALGYSEDVSAVALAGGRRACSACCWRCAGRVSWRGPAAVLVGVGIWFAMFESGVDAVIAGLAIGLVTSAYPPPRDQLERSTELTRSFREQPTPELAYTARASLVSAISPNERLQYRLHPWTSRVIVPLFALANAGIHLDGTLLSAAFTSPVTLGIIAAYVIGKPVGILGATWLSTRMGHSRLTVTWPVLVGAAASAGIGFTVSLLVATLAFDGLLLEEATLGVLLTAVISPALAWVAFRVVRLLPADVRARQLGATAETIVDLAEDVDDERDHIRGNGAAPVTLLEYGDFECPYCANAAPTIRRILEHHGQDVRYVFRHLPLTDVHPNAQTAAEAAEAAAAQGSFWEMHDRLFAQQESGLSDIYRHAADIGLDLTRFAEDMRRRRYAGRVAEDVRSADASGVSGTPTFFVNGRRHVGVYDVDALTAAVKAAQTAAARRA